jgi:hypothetical protein
MTEKQKQQRNIHMMEDIIEYCGDNEMLIDIYFYVNGHRYSVENKPGATPIKTGKYIYYDCGPADVTQIVEYNNPETLTMTFEGPLYDMYNGYYGSSSAEDAITKIANKYGLYPEQGFAWSLAMYE